MPIPNNPGHIYATTYFRSVRLQEDHFRAVKNNGLKPELYFQLGWSKKTIHQHKELAKIIAGELPGCAIHLPYNAQGPGINNKDLTAMDELERSLEAARIYSPEHLIGHVEFKSLTDSRSGARKYLGFKNGPLDNEFHEPSQEFLDESVSYWDKILKGTTANLYLENTYEHSPLPIARLIDLLGPRAGFCFDIGHWFHYAMGRHWDNLAGWLDLIGPRLKHLHLHDNNGEADQHLGLGQADIDLPQAWLLLKGLNPHPSFTLENHRLEGLLQSLAYLKTNPLF